MTCRSRHKAHIAALALLLLAAPAPAVAEATQNDVLIAARALGFVENPPKGEVATGIVYSPAVPASVQAANDLRRLLEGGLTAGGLTLKPVLVEIKDVAQADVRLFFLAEGVGAEGEKVAAATRARHIPCVTLDVPQVQAGACTMGVRSKPKVEILVSRANAAAGGITFAGGGGIVKRILLGAVSMVVVVQGARAQSIDYGALEQLFGEPVTTSATGSPERAGEVPVAMEIVTAEDIRRSGAHDIPGVLRHVAGIDVLQWTNDQADVSVRGYNEAYSHRLLVLIDGRQVYADHYGYTPWRALPVELDAIRQIEIVKGPASALFGFNAVGGVINIVTYNPLYDNIRTATLTGGTQDLIEGTAIGTFSLGDIGAVRLSGGASANKDFHTPVPPAMGSLRAAHDRGEISGDGVFKLGERANLKVEASYVEADLNEVNPIYTLGLSQYFVTSVRGLLTADTSYGLLSADAAGTWTNVYSPSATLGNLAFKNQLFSAKVQDIFKAGTSHTFRVSAEYRNTGQDTTPFPGGRVSYDTVAAGAMWEWKIGPELALTNAGRLDHLQLGRTGSAPPGYPFPNNVWDRSFTEFSYTGGLVWHATEEDTFRLTASQGAQVPNLEFVGGFTALTPFGSFTGLPTLVPTDVSNYEAAWNRRLPGLDGAFSLAVFRQHTHDAIAIEGGIIPTPTGPYFTQMEAGDSEMAGVAAELRGRFAGHWRWGVNARYESVDDKFLPTAGYIDFEHTTPRYVVKGNLGATYGRWEIDGYLHYQSHTAGLLPAYLGGPSTLAPIPAYVSLDGRIAYTVTAWMRLSLSAQNFGKGNQRQTSGANVERRVFGSVTFDF